MVRAYCVGYLAGCDYLLVVFRWLWFSGCCTLRLLLHIGIRAGWRCQDTVTMKWCTTSSIHNYSLFSRISFFLSSLTFRWEAGRQQSAVGTGISIRQSDIFSHLQIVAVAPSPADWSASSNRPGLRCVSFCSVPASTLPAPGSLQALPGLNLTRDHHSRAQRVAEE